jgi:membrane fusion protein, multidrug efflux system
VRRAPHRGHHAGVPEPQFAGEVSSVDSTIDPVTRSITVRAIIPNDERDLVPGMLMTLNLLRNERDAMVISEEAVIPRGDRHLRDGGGHGRRALYLAERAPGDAWACACPDRSRWSPARVGETIITHGAMKVRPAPRCASRRGRRHPAHRRAHRAQPGRGRG